MKKLFVFFAMFLFPAVAMAGTISFDQLAVSTDLTTTKYNSDLNRAYQKINYDIDNTNILNDTITEADCGDDMNPRIRTYEGAACEYVYTGLLPPTSASLTASTTAGTAYPRGYRVVKSSATAKTYTASKWTWVDIDVNGDFTYSEAAIGGATPAVAANSIRLAKVSTDATTVNAVTDLRTTSCSNGPFSIIADASGEADLGDIFTYGNGGWHNGLNVTSKDATTIYVQPGAARINGEYRALTTALNIDTAVTASPSSGVSGLDAGSLAASTTYYVYGVADVDGVTPLTGIMSTSASSPSGATNYRRLGEVTSDSSASLVSADAVSVHYMGKLRQRKILLYRKFFEGSTNIPDDDTPILITEGDQLWTMKFTPTSTNNNLLITIWGAITHQGSGEQGTLALFKDTDGAALASGSHKLTGNNNGLTTISFNYFMHAPSTSAITFQVRGGSENQNFEINGCDGGRKYAGSLSSGMMIEEYEP